jgi:hypothetical protein
MTMLDQMSSSVDPQRRRGRRVLILLAVLWAMNAFDLASTILARDLAHFNEANPIARPIVDQPLRIAAFKLSALVLATAILAACRRRRPAELACWGLCAVYLTVVLIWLSFFARYPNHVPGGDRPGPMGEAVYSSSSNSNGRGASEMGRHRPTLTSSPRAMQLTNRLDPP